MNLALNVAQNHVPGVKVDVSRWEHLQDNPVRLAAAILQTEPGPETVAALQKARAASGGDLLALRPVSTAALTGNAPDRLRTAVGLVLGSPDFQRR